MQQWIADRITGLQVGEYRRHQNLAVFPLLGEVDSGPEYLTLGEALQKDLVTAEEVSEQGSVSKLRIRNKADVPVLLLDGEELAGAKQNRVLNTTVLIPAESETIVPVSCTEQGRWSYRSDTFKDSGHAMSAHHRGRKSRSVSSSLSEKRTFESDQSEVWDDIQKMQEDTGTASPTSAMSDVYESRRGELGEYAEAFSPVEDQVGLLAAVNGRVRGFDAFSRAEACRKLHPKLIKSYAMDALLQKERKESEPDFESAEAFLDEAAASEGESYESPGLGTDWRFEGYRLVGSALTCERVVIHSAFFRLEDGGGERNERMSSFRARREFRSEGQ